MFFRTLGELYSWYLPHRLVDELESRHYSVPAYLNWFWHARRFPPSRRQLSDNGQFLGLLVLLGSLAQIAWGVYWLVNWARTGAAGGWEFGAALLISYPIVWAHLLALVAALGWCVFALAHPRKAGRALVCSVLEAQVRQLRRKHEFQIVAVVGSVGKTSTKLAIADLLSHTKRVRWQKGNYNDRVTVPLVVFGRDEPNLLNIFAWLRIFRDNARAIKSKFPYDVVVVELGTDGPGQLTSFAYLQPDIAVVTAVSPEHMEFFGTLDAVAAEELTVFEYARRVLVNADDIAGKYLVSHDFLSYSLESKQSDYFAIASSNSFDGQNVSITTPTGSVKANVTYIGRQGAKFVLAAAATADMLELKRADIEKYLPKLQHFAGRMQVLPGVRDSVLIDDTYNASPIAVYAALDVLYDAKSKQRITILGSMNELGDYSRQAHEEVGAYCNAKKLDVVVTIGHDAERWLAPAARKQGCAVKSFSSPYEAGEFVKSIAKKGAVILAKGSQNGVFAEEALKPLLANPEDIAKLVRQSSYWLKIKAQQFGKPFGFLSKTND